VGSDLGSRGCLSRNYPEPITLVSTNNCARQVSKVVYNKSAETGLQLAQPSLSLCKLLPLQNWWLTISCKDGTMTVLKIIFNRPKFKIFFFGKDKQFMEENEECFEII
jgi:hypothetical protein